MLSRVVMLPTVVSESDFQALLLQLQIPPFTRFSVSRPCSLSRVLSMTSGLRVLHPKPDFSDKYFQLVSYTLWESWPAACPWATDHAMGAKSDLKVPGAPGPCRTTCCKRKRLGGRERQGLQDTLAGKLGNEDL